MVSNPFPLEQIKIASPCFAKWSEMIGDDRVRFCLECHKNVYNLTAMSRSEAEALVLDVESVACVRLYRKADGTVITDDCPIGLRATRKVIHWTLGCLATGLAMIITVVTGQAMDKDPRLELRQIEPFATVLKWISPTPPPPPPSRCVMGKR